MGRYGPLNGFELAGCAVRRRSILAFWGQKWDNPDPLDTRVTRIYFYYPEKPDKDKWAYREIGETRGIRGCGVVLPEDRWVFVADDGEVYVVGGGQEAFESPVVDKPFSFFTNVKRIPPGHACAVGTRRKVYLREAVDTWRHLSAGLSLGPEDSPQVAGFSDIDGFGPSDLYACGGQGELWHFNGDAWARVDIPTNEMLWRVCCASDGRVYVIAGERGILAGREQSWHMLDAIPSESRFESIVDFSGKVIVSTQSALFEISGGAVVPASLGDMPSIGSRSFLAAGDGLLLVAGNNGACSFDGRTWSIIIEPQAEAGAAPG